MKTKKFRIVIDVEYVEETLPRDMIKELAHNVAICKDAYGLLDYSDSGRPDLVEVEVNIAEVAPE